jgi:hypothetical protein
MSMAASPNYETVGTYEPTGNYEAVVSRTDASNEVHGRSIGTTIAGLFGTAALLLGGYWSITTVIGGAEPARSPQGWVHVPGEKIKIGEAVRLPKSAEAKGAFRRFQVNVTVAAGEDPLVVDASSFRIDGYHVYLGMEPVKAVPHVKRIKPHKKESFSLTYQVVREADSFSLIFEGSDNPIPFRVSKN